MIIYNTCICPQDMARKSVGVGDFLPMDRSGFDKDLRNVRRKMREGIKCEGKEETDECIREGMKCISGEYRFIIIMHVGKLARKVY